MHRDLRLQIIVCFRVTVWIWELNYRGNLSFSGTGSKAGREKEFESIWGWTYFIHGWTQVIAEIFHIEIKGSMLDRLSAVAREV